MRLCLLDDPPLELDVFGDGGVETDSEGLVVFGEDLEVLIFATFGYSYVDL